MAAIQPGARGVVMMPVKAHWGPIETFTTITREYSIANGEPYYPVPNQENRDLYEKYRQEAEKLEERGIYFIGRLASYKYFNMNQAVRAALDLFYRLEED